MSDISALNTLIKEISDLGGSIKNIEVDHDESGLTLRVSKPENPFEITLPEHLQLDPADFDNESCSVRDSADIAEPVRAFWNAYVSAINDDANRAAAAEMRQAIGMLLEENSETFEMLGLTNFLQADIDKAAINQRMLASMIIRTEKGSRAMPFMGLARQGRSQLNISRTVSGSLTINGSSARAVIINSGRFDSLWALNTKDVADPSMVAMSLPLSLPLGSASGKDKSPRLVVGRNVNQSAPFKGAFAPIMRKEGNVVRLSHLALSFFGRPALALGIFRSLTREHSIGNPDELWGRIKSYNLRRLFSAYKVAKGIENTRLNEKLSGALSLQIETLIESH